MRPCARRAALAAALLLAAAGTAAAHAFLNRALPAVGSTVKTSPQEVRLWFTEPLEPAFSTVEVQDAAGRRIDKGDSHVDQSNPKLLAASLPPLGPGIYKVVWRVVSVDTHATRGDHAFVVAP